MTFREYVAKFKKMSHFELVQHYTNRKAPETVEAEYDVETLAIYHSMLWHERHTDGDDDDSLVQCCDELGDDIDAFIDMVDLDLTKWGKL